MLGLTQVLEKLAQQIKVAIDVVSHPAKDWPYSYPFSTPQPDLTLAKPWKFWLSDPKPNPNSLSGLANLFLNSRLEKAEATGAETP